MASLIKSELMAADECLQPLRPEPSATPANGDVIDLAFYRDRRMHNFLKFPFSQQMRALCAVLERDGHVQCLRSDCDYQCTSANGMLIHLCRCRDVQEPPTVYTDYKGRMNEFLKLDKEHQLDSIDNHSNILKSCLNEPSCTFLTKSALVLVNHINWCGRQDNNAKLDGVQKAIAAAFGFYEQHRNRIAEWYSIADSKRKKLVDFLFGMELILTCLSCGQVMECGDAVKHLNSCGIKQQIKREIRINPAVKHTRQEKPQKKKARPSKDYQDTDYSPRKRNEPIQKGAGRKLITCNDSYENYKGRIKEWQKLEMVEQRRMIHFALRQSKTGELECLDPECTVCVATGPGMLYHSQRCGLPKNMYPSKCPACELRMPVKDVDDHVKENHPDYTKDSQQKSDKPPRIKEKKIEKTAILVPADVLVSPAATPKRQSAIKAELLMVNVKEEASDKKDETYEHVGDGDNSSEDDSAASSASDEPIRFDPTTGKRKYKNRTKRFKICSIDQFINRERRHELMQEVTQRMLKFAEDNYAKTPLYAAWTSDCKMIPFEKLDISYLPPLKESMQVQFLPSQKAKPIPLFHSRRMREGCAVFCGGPVSCMSWCPTPSSLLHQYLAVAVLPDPNLENLRQEKDAIQIWNVGGEEKPNECSCKLLIAHELGSCLSMCWCPSGGYTQSRLGLLCAGFASGVVAIFGVPQPSEAEAEVYHLSPVVKMHITDPPAPVVAVHWSPFTAHQQILVTAVYAGIYMIELETATLHCVVQSCEARYANWISRNKIVIHYDRVLSPVELYNLSEAKCEVAYNAKWDSLGSTSATAPQLTHTFICLPTKSNSESRDAQNLYVPTMVSSTAAHVRLGSFLPRKPLGASISQWTGQVAVCDEGGNVVVALNQYVLASSLPKKVTTKNLFKLQTVLSLANESSSIDSQTCTSYDECVNEQTLILRPPDNSLPMKAVVGMRNEEYSSQFPMRSLFHVHCNVNQSKRHWICAAGQSGCVFFMHVQP